MAGTDLTGGEEVEVKKEGCDWKGCQGEPHTLVPPYKDRIIGDIEKKPIQIDFHPNQYGKFGQKSLIWIFPYRTNPFSNGKCYYNYRYQRHHVIPGNLVKRCPDLFENLRLMGWNINSPTDNCLILPMYDMDIVWHDLQPHRGSHNEYDDKVEDDLMKLQQKCLAFCINSEKDDNTLKTQYDLIDELNKRIKNFIEKILNWKKGFILVTCSHYQNNLRKSRATIFATESDSGTVPTYPWRTLD